MILFIIGYAGMSERMALPRMLPITGEGLGIRQPPFIRPYYYSLSSLN